MNCIECDKRSTCTTLCDEAEAYVNQDHVPQTELCVDTLKVDQVINDTWACDIQAFTYLTTTEKKIVTLWGYGLTRQDVRKLLDISAQGLRKHIERLRKKLL